MKKDEIATELASNQLNIAGIVEKSADENSGYFVYVSVTRDREGVQSPSNFKLKKIKDNFNERGVVLDFIISDELANNIEAGLRATLLINHSDFIRNVFLSLDSREARVWIDPKPNAQEHLTEIDSTARLYLRGFKLKLLSTSLTINENLPTAFVILKALRICAPASLNELSDKIKSKNLAIPSDDWLKRKLDGLRKKELVVWLKGELDQPHSYALSLKALKALGTEKKRSSADIVRLLAIAKVPT